MIYAMVFAALFQQYITPAKGVSHIDCKMVEHAKIYSNARYIEEADDVVGVEFAVFPDGHALLFDYEGTAESEPLRLDRGTDVKKLVWKGISNRHVVEQPSGREIVQRVTANVKATLRGNSLHANIQIDAAQPETVDLKLVKHLWSCGGSD